jgi:hypothetical protein
MSILTNKMPNITKNAKLLILSFVQKFERCANISVESEGMGGK